jgi:NAD(P) transhydrogenase
METPTYDYDLFVIGSGPAGQRAAIQAAKLGKRVALAERKAVVGGVCTNTGTIPSKSLREAAIYLSGTRLKGIYGASYAVKDDITIDDLTFRTDHVVKNEIEVIRDQLHRNGVRVIGASARFEGVHELRLDIVGEDSHRKVTAEKIVIATGSGSSIEGDSDLDGQIAFVAEDILQLGQLPRTLAVVGAGVIGCEYASIFAALGVKVTMIDMRHTMLPFVDREIVESLTYHLRQNRTMLRLGEEVTGINPYQNGRGPAVKIELASGKQIAAEKVLYAAGRSGATASLNLEAAGVVPDERGRLSVNSDYQTAAPNIYAVGDVIGFPSLASTSMEQGRHAALHAFGQEVHHVPELFPFAIYTIPEISMVGRTEEELTEAGVPYEVGKAYYREIARGQIIGDTSGLLKLIFHLETMELLGVHIIGEGASELVHIGQAVLAFGGTVDYFLDTVFNYPTLAECYKTAALDCLNRKAG